MRAAYAAADCEVKRLIHTEGEASVWQRVAQRKNDWPYWLWSCTVIQKCL